MKRQVVAVVGAGNVRTAPWVLASLASFYPDWPVEVRLHDTHPDQLMLATMLFERLVECKVAEPEMTPTSELDEALLGADDIVVTLCSNTARRMVGPLRMPHLEALEAEPDPFELRKGDRNRPTRSGSLRPETREASSSPSSELTEEQALGAAHEQVRLRASGRVLVVGRREEQGWESWVEPETDPRDDLALAYEILRWARRDEPVDAVFDLVPGRPLLRWLKLSR